MNPTPVRVSLPHRRSGRRVFLISPQLYCLRRLDDCILVHSLTLVSRSKEPVRSAEIWVHVNRLPQLVYRLVVSPGKIICVAQNAVDDERERIEFQGAAYLADRFVVSRKRHQKLAAPLMRGGIVWIQLNRAIDFS